MEQQKIQGGLENIYIPPQTETLEKIAVVYKAAVGIDPIKNGLTREEMLSGIKNPLMERERMCMIEEGFDDFHPHKTGQNQ